MIVVATLIKAASVATIAAAFYYSDDMADGNVNTLIEGKDNG